MFSNAGLAKSQAGLILAVVLWSAPNGAIAQPMATPGQQGADLARRAQATVKAVPRLDDLIGQTFFQIPLAEQRSLNIRSDDYRQSYAEPISGWLEKHRNTLEGELRTRFEALTYDAMAKRRAAGQPIQYCAWIPGARIDGLLPTGQDFLYRFREACRQFALTAVARMTAEKIEKIAPSLSGIRALEDDIPRWIVADLAMATEAGPNFDGLAYDASYRAAMDQRLRANLPEMTRTIGQHFAGLSKPSFPLPHPATLCRELLGGAHRLAGFALTIGEALKGACLSEARDWAGRFEADIRAGLQSAIRKDRQVRLLTSASIICRLASTEVLGDGALLAAPLRQSLMEQCSTLAQVEETELIRHHAARAVASLEIKDPALVLLRKTRWLMIEPADQRAFIDPRVLTDNTLMTRFAETLESNLSPLRKKAAFGVEQDIQERFAKASEAREAFDSARGFCMEIRAAVSAAPAQARDLASRVGQSCLNAEQALLQAMIEKAIAASGIDQLQGQVLVIGSAALDPKALVVASAIAGRTMRFSRGWWGSELKLIVTSSFGGSSELEARFRASHSKGQFELASIDPIPGYSAAPIEIAACLFRSPEQDDRIAVNILQTMHSLLDGVRLAFVHELGRERCDKALRAYFQ